MARPTVQLGCQEGETGRSQCTAARHFASDARPGRVRFSCKSGTTEFANPTGWERPSGSRLSRRGWPFDPGFKRNPGVADGSISRPASEPLDAISSHPAFVSVRAVLCSSCAIESRACLSGLARKFAHVCGVRTHVALSRKQARARHRRERLRSRRFCGRRPTRMGNARSRTAASAYGNRAGTLDALAYCLDECGAFGVEKPKPWASSAILLRRVSRGRGVRIGLTNIRPLA